MQNNLSLACLSKMLSNATWALCEATKLGVEPLMDKYSVIAGRLRLAIEDRMRRVEG